MDRSKDHFLTPIERATLEALLRERKAAGLKIRRANALLLLDDGFAPIDVARVLYLDEETIRVWKRSFEGDGLGSLDLKAYSKRDGHLTEDQEAQLATMFRARPPKTTDEVRAIIAKLFDVTYSRSGAIKLMGRLGFCYKKPKALPLGADEAAQIAQIEAYEALLNGLEYDERGVRRRRSSGVSKPPRPWLVPQGREGRDQGHIWAQAAQHPRRLRYGDLKAHLG